MNRKEDCKNRHSWFYEGECTNCLAEWRECSNCALRQQVDKRGIILQTQVSQIIIDRRK